MSVFQAMRRMGMFGTIVAGLAAAIGVRDAGAQTPALKHDSFTDITGTSTFFGTTPVQGANPGWTQRGTFVDGSMRAGSSFAWASAANPFESGHAGARWMGPIDLFNGTVHPSETDLALPAPGFSWVIGRSYSAATSSAGSFQGRGWFQNSQPELQQSDAEGPGRLRIVYGADRWLEFVPADHPGADSTTSDPAAVRLIYRGVNGAAGLILKRTLPAVDSETHPIDLYTYIDQNGGQTTFFGFNLDEDKGMEDDKRRGQLWKLEDAAGHIAYVGHPVDARQALTDGYDSEGRITTAYDAAGMDIGSPATDQDGRRRYSYEYQTIGSVDRLQTITVDRFKAATSSWQNVALVRYDYAEGTPASSAICGQVGDLVGVSTRVLLSPRSDEGTAGPAWLVTRKHYRYAVDGGVSRLELIVGDEGTRRFHFDSGGTFAARMAAWEDMDQFPTSLYTTGTVAVNVSDLSPYADLGVTYNTTGADAGKVATAFFSGRCGCGSSSNGLHTFTYETSCAAAPTTFEGLATAVRKRTMVRTPAEDNRTVTPNIEVAYQVQYFNDLGQPMSAVTLQSTSSTPPSSTTYSPTGTSDRGKVWITGVERDGDGCVSAIHNTDNITTYQHLDSTTDCPNWGKLTYSDTAGLVTRMERVTSGFLQGFATSARQCRGNGSSVAWYAPSAVEYNASVLSMEVTALGASAATFLNRPVVTFSRTYNGAAGGETTGSPTLEGETAITFVSHDDGSTTLASPARLVPTLVGLIAPTVSDTQNGSNVAPTPSYSHYDRAGRLALSLSVDGRVTSREYDPITGQLSAAKYDIPTGSPETHGGQPFASSSSGTDPALDINTLYEYDIMGRPVATISPSFKLGTSRSVTRYSRLGNHQLVAIGLALDHVDGSSVHNFYGPGSVSVVNHAGNTTFSATVGLTEGTRRWHDGGTTTTPPIPTARAPISTTVDPADWVLLTAENPFSTLTSSIVPTSLALRGRTIQLYGKSGTQLERVRSYFRSPNSTLGITDARDDAFDETIFQYDAAGRLTQVEDQTSTLTMFKYDTLGRRIEVKNGMVIPSTATGVFGGSGSTPEQRSWPVAQMQYDLAWAGPIGSSIPSNSIQVADFNLNDSTEQLRTTSIIRDVRGIPFAVVGPQSIGNHALMALDFQGRPTVAATFSGAGPTRTRAGILAAMNETNAQLLTTGTGDSFGEFEEGRLEALSRVSYDSMGRIYKVEKPRVRPLSDTTHSVVAADGVTSQRWFDVVGRVAMTSGSSIEKTQYDRACRVTARFIIANAPTTSGKVTYQTATAPPGNNEIIVRQSLVGYHPKTGVVLGTMTVDAWPDSGMHSGSCADPSGMRMTPFNPKFLVAEGTEADAGNLLMKWPLNGSGALVGLPRGQFIEYDHLDRPVRRTLTRKPLWEMQSPTATSIALPVPTAMQGSGWSTDVALKVAIPTDPFAPPARAYPDVGSGGTVPWADHGSPNRQRISWFDDFGRPVAEFGDGLEGWIEDFDGDEEGGSDERYAELLMVWPADPVGCGTLPSKPFPTIKRKKDRGRPHDIRRSFIPRGGMLTPEEIQKQIYPDQIWRATELDINPYIGACTPPGFTLDGKPITGWDPIAEFRPHGSQETMSPRAIPSGGTVDPILLQRDSQGRLIYQVDENGTVRETYYDDSSPDEVMKRIHRISPPSYPSGGPGAFDPAHQNGGRMEYEFGPGEQIKVVYKDNSTNSPLNELRLRNNFGPGGPIGTEIPRLVPRSTPASGGDPWFPADMKAPELRPRMWPMSADWTPEGTAIGGSGTGLMLSRQLVAADTVLPGGRFMAYPSESLGTTTSGQRPSPMPADLHIFPVPARQCFSAPKMEAPTDYQTGPAGTMPSVTNDGLEFMLGRTGYLGVWPPRSGDVMPLPGLLSEPPAPATGNITPTGTNQIERYGGYTGIDSLPWAQQTRPDVFNPQFDPYFGLPAPLSTDFLAPGLTLAPNQEFGRRFSGLDEHFRPQVDVWTPGHQFVTFSGSTATVNRSGMPMHFGVHIRQQDGQIKTSIVPSFPQWDEFFQYSCENGKVKRKWVPVFCKGLPDDSVYEAQYELIPDATATRELETWDTSGRGNWGNYSRQLDFPAFAPEASPPGTPRHAITFHGSGTTLPSTVTPQTFSPETTGSSSSPTFSDRGGDDRLLEAQVSRKTGSASPVTHTIAPKYSPGGYTIEDGERFRYWYDARGLLTQVDRNTNTAGPWAEPLRGLPVAKFTYDALGRRTSATHDRNGNGKFEDEFVEFFINDNSWRVAATYRQAPAPKYAAGWENREDTAHASLSSERPTPLLYERYVYHARGIGGASDNQGLDRPILRQRFRYYQTFTPPIGFELGEQRFEVFSPLGTLEDGGLAAVPAEAEGTGEGQWGYVRSLGYDVADQETIYYAQTHRGDVVSLTSEDGKLLETVRYTAYGVPRVFRLGINPSDIADDAGTPLWHGMPADPGVANTGVNEGDYNAFFAGFFDALAYCDIADDEGNPLPSSGVNSGVNEGDYNLFFQYFYDGVYPTEITDDTELEWGVLSFGDQVRDRPQTGNRIGYAGYWWDETLNMYYVRNRWYMPRTGRWLTPDPIGFAGGPNLFEYCGGRPTNRIDPLGLWSVADVFGGGAEVRDQVTGRASAQDAAWRDRQIAQATKNAEKILEQCQKGQIDSARAQRLMDMVENGLVNDIGKLDEVRRKEAPYLNATVAAVVTLVAGPAAAPILGALSAAAPTTMAIVGTGLAGVGVIASAEGVSDGVRMILDGDVAGGAAVIGVNIFTGWQSATGFYRGSRQLMEPGSTVGTSGCATCTPRLPQDIRVNPTPPAVRPLSRPIGSDPAQNARMQADIVAARAAGGTNFRVDQHQINASGQRVGINRPDLQYTNANGQRVYVEYDLPGSTRGPGHAARLLANDPHGIVILRE